MFSSASVGFVELRIRFYAAENEIYVGEGHGAWGPRDDDPEKWMQVDFTRPYEVKGIVTQVRDLCTQLGYANLSAVFKDMAFGAAGSGFVFWLGQVGHSVANGSPPLDVSSKLC